METLTPVPLKPLAPTRNRFDLALERHGCELERGRIRTLQINLGRLCNQACKHCHVEAGPKRTEVMDWPVMERVLALAGDPGVEVVDLTGGAPEMNPHFRRLVSTLRAMGKNVLSRCNLTILMEPGYEDLAGFYASEGVYLVSSLPCYGAENVDRQRGNGVFEKSIAALRLLNREGYGVEGHPGGLRLDLVYNPGGPFLPGDQPTLEADYRRELHRAHGVRFTSLLALTNLPIGRFASELARRGEQERYVALLEQAFNPQTVPGLMCRDTLNIGWDGRVFDCDFNQMLNLDLGPGHWNVLHPEFTLSRLNREPIRTGSHCLGCTAGAGSSCGGALV